MGAPGHMVTCPAEFQHTLGAFLGPLPGGAGARGGAPRGGGGARGTLNMLNINVELND